MGVWRDTGVEDVPHILRLVRALAEYERLAESCVATEADFAAALFGDRPDAPMLAGVALIIAGGLWLWRAGREREPPQAPD